VSFWAMWKIMYNDYTMNTLMSLILLDIISSSIMCGLVQNVDRENWSGYRRWSGDMRR
jgi:hypothetical protein